MHVHVITGDGEAKFWFESDIELARNYRLTRQQLKSIETIIEEHYNGLTGAWKRYFPR